MDRFAILLAGRITTGAALSAALAGRRVVAADGGMAHAAALALVPELWIGDFDSEPSGLAPHLANVERQMASRDKDATDGELAIEAAIARGARDLLLVGALGGARSDHAFTHLVLTLRYAAQGLAIALFDGNEHVLPLGAMPRRLDCPAGTPFSVLRFSDVEGLSVRGARWPLDDVDLPFHSILTQSNEALGPIEVRVRRGRALLLVQAAQRA